jgi:putative tricarboxylic transport membrane protein
MNLRQLLVASAASLTLVFASSGAALGQAKYPSKNIEVVVPYAPGGGTDNMMRMITAIMEENKWSPQPINVNNRAGGSGTVGYSYLITKKGDSHVVAGATPMIVSGKLQGRLSGNHRDAMTILMIVAIDELMLSVRTDSPYKTLEDFVNAARAKPGQLTVGGTGTHNEDHIFAHLLEQSAKIKLKYVPFNSGGEATAALMGGHIDAGIMNPERDRRPGRGGQGEEPRGGRAQANERRRRRPDLREKGYPFYWEQMRGVVGPAGMAPEAVAWWQDTLKKVVASKKWQDDYIKVNLLTPTAWTGEEANKYLDRHHRNYEKALADLGGLKK